MRRTDPGVPNITIYTQLPKPEACDTMWADCESQAVCLIVEHFGDHIIRAARCEKHLQQERPDLAQFLLTEARQLVTKYASKVWDPAASQGC